MICNHCSTKEVRYKKEGVCVSCYYQLHKKTFKRASHNWVTNNREKKAAYMRKYYKTEAGKEAMRKALKKYQDNNTQRKKCWEIAGRLIAKKPCQVCGLSEVHRHHPDINKPLNVVFLCPLHHKAVENGGIVL